jgi:hypothetical protein
MPKHKLLIDRKNEQESLLLYEILGGKPNNKLLPSEQTIAGRVVRPKQKGLTCHYYALRILANRLGKHPDIQNTEERKVERILSAARKEITAFSLRARSRNLLLDYADLLDHQDNQTNMRMIQMDLVNINGTEEEKKEFVQAVADFSMARSKNKELKFQTFIANRMNNDFNDTHIKAAKITGIDAKNELEHEDKGIRVNINLFNKTVMDDETYDSYRYNLFPITAFLTLGKFTPVAWIPGDSAFEDLSVLLKNNGPLMAGGYYGKSFYDSKSDHRLSLGKAELSTGNTVDLNAQYWKAEERIPDEAMGHAVVLVGTYAKGNSKLVLFVDPADESLPNKASKLYAMSYKTLCEHACMTDSIRYIKNGRVDGFLYAAPPEPENPKLKMKY